MGSTGTFLQLLSLIGFLAATWFASRISRKFFFPSLVLEIGIGILLGPGVARLVGPEYAVCESRRFETCALPPDFDRLVQADLPIGPALGRIANMDYCPFNVYQMLQSRLNSTNDTNATGSNMSSWCNETNSSNGTNGTNCTVPLNLPYRNYGECLQRSCVNDLQKSCEDNPGLFTLVGHAGVGLVLFEAGMRLSLKQISPAGAWGCGVAFVGSLIPFLTGMGLTVLYGRPIVPDGVLVGTALVPTGSSVVYRLLRELGLLQSNFGQVVAVAALVDDLIALLLFNIFSGLGGEFDGFRTVASPIVGVVLVVFTLLVAAKFWPPVLQGFILPKVSQITFVKLNQDEVLYFVMFGWLVGFAWIMSLLGGFLWGCFMAGMSFAYLDNLEDVRRAWNKQTKPIVNWLLRIFFACTVAFTIHPEVMFSGESFWKGTVMGVFMGILFKVAAGMLVYADKSVVGWAMVGRGELAFFIAQMSASVGLMDQMTYTVVIWALIWATTVGPTIFRTLLRHRTRLQQATGEPGLVEAPEQRLSSLEGIDLEEQEEPPEKQPARSLEAASEAPASEGRHKLLCCLFLKAAGP